MGMETGLQQAAGDFCQAIKSTDEHNAFLEAHSWYSSSQELTELRASYGELVEKIQGKQAAGEDFQEDIDAVREIQREVSQHEATEALIQAQRGLQGLLRQCNAGMTAILEVDFAQAASPQHDCGGCSGC